MMKMLLVAVAFAAGFATSFEAKALPTNSNVSFGYWNTRQFNTSRTDTSIGCTFGTCGGISCYKLFMRGYNPVNTKCCEYEYICREDGTVDEALVKAANERISAEDNQVAEIFRTDDGTRPEAYWGYVGTTTNRSPSAGRGQSGTARLDACIGHGETDLFSLNTSGWNSCYNTCDSTTNGYCNNTVVNNGTSMANGSCKDRCDCHFNPYIGTQCDGL